MYGLDYAIASDEMSLKENLNLLYQSDKPIILEVFTPTKNNDKILLDYFKNVV